MSINHPKINRVRDRLEHIFKSGLKGVFVFGSYARDDFKPGLSDFNFLIVFDVCGKAELSKLAAIQKKSGRKITLLGITEKWLKSSLDTFPVEILDFKLHHKLLFGHNMIEDLKISPEYLRIQCERELKSKLNLLRQVFISCGLNERRLSAFLRDHLPALAAVFQALLYLKGIPIPSSRVDLYRETGKVCQLPQTLTDSLTQISKTGRLTSGRNPEEQYFGLIDGLEFLSDQVDKLEISD